MPLQKKSHQKSSGFPFGHTPQPDHSTACQDSSGIRKSCKPSRPSRSFPASGHPDSRSIWQSVKTSRSLKSFPASGHPDSRNTACQEHSENKPGPPCQQTGTKNKKIEEPGPSVPVVRNTLVPAVKKPVRAFQLAKVLAVLVWGILLLVVFCNKQFFILDSLLSLHLTNPVLSACILMMLFALKSLSFFLYAGLLYLASGLLFPYPTAVLISIAGAVVMASLPYGLGRWLGIDLKTGLLRKYPQMQKLDDIQNHHSFLSVLVIWVLGFLPLDPVSLYFGACQIPYGSYILASALAFMPHILTYPLMGTSIHHPSSPAFIAGAILEVLWTGLCFGTFFWYQKKSKSAQKKTASVNYKP